MDRYPLFRFASIAPTQLISEENKQIGFVFHHNLAGSTFYSAVSSLTTQSSIESALTSTALSFSNIEALQSVRAVDSDLFDFALWIAKNYLSITISDLSTRTASLSALSTANKDTLWENVFYQVVTNENNSVADSCIRLLLGNYFLEEFNTFMGGTPGPDFTTEEKAKFERIANGSIVIPIKIGKRNDLLQTGDEFTENINSPMLFDTLTDNIANTNLEKLNLAEKELKKIFVTFNEELSSELESTNKTGIESTISDTETKLAASNTITRPATPPAFSTTLKYDSSYLTGKVSAKTLAIFNEVSQTVNDSLEPVLSSISSLKQQQYRNMLGSKRHGIKTAIVNGTHIVLEDRPKNNTFACRFEPTLEDPTKYSLHFAQYFVQRAAQFNKVTISVSENGGNSVSDSESISNVQLKDDHHIVAELFKDGLGFASGGTVDLTISMGNLEGPTGSVNLNPVRLGTTAMAKVGTNADGNPDSESGTLSAPHYGITKLGTATFRRVEQKLCEYVPGEVSHIENIMAREYKERSTRSLSRSEVSVTEERTEETEQITDTATTERFELQSEVQAAFEESQSQSTGWSAGVQGSYSPPPASISFNANAFGNHSNSSSNSGSTSDSVQQAKEIVQKAVEKVVQKVSTRRTSKMIKEFEENNRHGFDNKEGSSHVTGVYRWVDRVYDNFLVNYGRRLMYEFSIPEPAKNFKESLRNLEVLPNNIRIIPRPLTLDEVGISRPEDLNQENYTFLAGLYNTEVREFPPSEVTTSKAYSEVSSDATTGYSIAKSYNDLIIPEGYKCHFIRFTGGMLDIPGNDMWPEGQISIGGRSWILYAYHTSAHESIWYPIEGTLPVSIRAKEGSFNANVTAFCSVKDSHIKEWQIETFNLLHQAYGEKIELYNQQMAQLAASGEATDFQVNSAESRSIEIQEIKRICIELMTKPFNINVSRNNYFPANDNDIFRVNATEEFQKHSARVKFLEAAFDWDLMAYNFYSYFYANEEVWHSLMNSTGNGDSIFQAFLKSGMAKAVVAVKPGFEPAVNLFMETGTIWNGNGFVLDADDDLYISVDEELQSGEEVVEDKWKSRIPSSLTIIQESSTYLAGSGLPSFCEDGTPLAVGTSELGVTTTPA